MRPLPYVSSLLVLAVAVGCSDAPSTPAASTTDAGSAPQAGDPTWLSADVQSQWAALQESVQAAEATTTEQLLERHRVAFQDLDYDPLQAQHLDLIEASPLSLSQAQKTALGENGFVVLADHNFPSFAYAYETLYMMDLPLYVSADSILDAVHRSYDDILTAFEYQLLIPELSALLGRLNQRLADMPVSATRADLDLYLTVARSLLDGPKPPLAGADADKIAKLVQIAEAAEGTAAIELFGAPRAIDASQFKPRGHYEDDPTLQRYFRAGMWLGRTDFMLVETVDGGRQELHRAQVDAMLLLDSLFTETDRAAFQRIDDVIRAFVGESDNMTLAQVPALLAALGVSDHDVSGIDDETLMRTILAHGFGKQQIMSHLMEGGVDAPVPLNASFLLLGQRYVVDSHVFSNVVWDRTASQRMMPDPLDVAFAALGNDQAASLLKPQLEQYAYAGNLASMRTLVDEHDARFWEANLYNEWLGALRALSPTRELAAATAMGLPSFAATEAWGRRILSTQLGSWAQLRHDTLLYAKQSYTSGAVCEFPDAMVDPYPEFYAGIARFAARGTQLAELALAVPDAQAFSARITAYFAELSSVAKTLQGMAEHQRTGAPFTAEQLAFINDAVVIKSMNDGCVPTYTTEGWYARLFYGVARALEQEPTIADVHTQPTDEAGNDVGRILHVATGLPRLMVLTANTCTGPRAYVGPVTAYFEQTTDGWHRMTDSEWNTQLTTPGQAPKDVRWMTDLVAP
jgi:Protein of unknown function (DUF3160)